MDLGQWFLEKNIILCNNPHIKQKCFIFTFSILKIHIYETWN